MSVFNGTVLLEWLNVSAGRDIAVEWSYSQRELMRHRYAWLGASAQRPGIAGGGLVESTHLLAAEDEPETTRLDPAELARMKRLTWPCPRALTAAHTGHLVH